MRRLALSSPPAWGLVACSTEQMLAEHDDQACKAKGPEVGSVGYVDYRASLDKQRADAEGKRGPPKVENIPGLGHGTGTAFY